MKKLLTLTLLGSFLMGSDIEGVIQSINAGAKSIVVNGNAIQVMQTTKIKYDGCRGERDSYKQFSDLKVGDYVDIDTTYNQNKIVAKEIEIQCRQ